MEKIIFKFFASVILAIFCLAIYSCKISTNSGTTTKEDKTDKITIANIEPVKGFENIIVFEGQTSEGNQTVYFKDCKNFKPESTNDFTDKYLRSANGYEKTSGNKIEELKDVPDIISIDSKNGMLALSLVYYNNGDVTDIKNTIESVYFQSNDNLCTAKYKVNGKESVINGKLYYADMKLSGWKGNKMKVLLIEIDNYQLTYYVGPDW